MILILLCILFVMIIVMTCAIMVFENKSQKEEKEIAPHVTSNIEHEINIEYKGITNLKDITGNLLNCSYFMKDLENFLVEDIQECKSEDNIHEYYINNSKKFKREYFNISEESLNSFLDKTKNITNMKTELIVCEIVNKSETSKILKLTFNDNSEVTGTIQLLSDEVELIFE